MTAWKHNNWVYPGAMWFSALFVRNIWVGFGLMLELGRQVLDPDVTEWGF